MKKLILFMTLVLSSFFGFQALAQEVFSGPAISIDKETHDYGNIPYEANGECEFTITNTGTEPLIITGARGSCGCTVPEYPEEPIAPGKTAVIKVTYNTKLMGDFTKSVTISSNAVNEPTKVVFIKGNVAPKPEGSASDAPVTGSSVDTETPDAPATPTNGRQTNGSATLTTPKQ